MKNLLLITILLMAVSSCQKEAPTLNLPVYITDAKLNAYFNGTVPYLRISESGSSVEETFLINTCSNQNGGTYTFQVGKSYDVEFGIYVDNTWASFEGFNGTLTVDGDGNISGTITGIPGWLESQKSVDFGGCGSVIQGDICLFF
ncbi:MAG: hypothetical protein HRT57_02985 [Crocinitomicaceae bacterium]|nr:hypothetical protein [Crocinitomicaceae bacterium]